MSPPRRPGPDSARGAARRRGERLLGLFAAGVVALNFPLLSDPDGSVDRVRETIAVLFNATDDAQVYPAPSLGGFEFALHEVQQASADPVVALSGWDGVADTFTVPARTTRAKASRPRTAGSPYSAAKRAVKSALVDTSMYC